ncbi:SH3 domain-containing protein [Actibacterium sp. XHP0104]|uniref:SH3 domain-containing protein n=1 Tax=Actibacterium sp. XHP0104 TaxID=2984335 RepID=UPI001411F7B3|nr:SH3 domain-containing protein [Actibacterium sp. XHP0104]MCV2882244.1 SH3 domain-containing protein [Actibacterium sp. XHP0104]NHX28051.1 aspartyl-trna synthetase [Escherichia coli]
MTALSLGVAGAQERGSVTNLPIPRYVSLKAAEGYARHGPGQTHRIDWVYKHRNQPLEITGEYGHWRRVRDQDGMGGWMHYSLLSGVRTVLIEAEMQNLHRSPSAESQVVAHAERGVIAWLEQCTLDWCQVKAGRVKGWVQKSTLWGVRTDEVFE